MAAEKELRYQARYPVNGSLAYDLDWAVLERELNHAGEVPRRKEAEQAAPRVREKQHTAVREHQKVSVLMVVSFAAAAAMAIMVLLSYIQLTMISADTVALKQELSTLKSEQVVLTAQYERVFDMATVKEAAAAAGMAKPVSSQICYLDLSDADNAVVYLQEDNSVLSKLLTSMHHGVYAVVEYFR